MHVRAPSGREAGFVPSSSRAGLSESTLDSLSKWSPKLGWRPWLLVTRASLLVARTLLGPRALLLVARNY